MNAHNMEHLVTELTEFVRTRRFGKYRGRVEDVDDPENLGRIKVKVPAVYGEEISAWAMPCAPFAGDNQGAFTLPEPGSGVWVEFEAGDISFPIWSGCWWGSDEAPRDNSGTQAGPPVKIIRSSQGLMITFDDSSQTIALSDEDGSNLITIKVQEGQVTIQGTDKVVVEAPRIELVENAAHPVVFGDNLLQYLNQLVNLFNAHVHPGGRALGLFPVTSTPPQPIYPPATPDLISQKVKSG